MLFTVTVFIVVFVVLLSHYVGFRMGRRSVQDQYTEKLAQHINEFNQVLSEYEDIRQSLMNIQEEERGGVKGRVSEPRLKLDTSSIKQ